MDSHLEQLRKRPDHHKRRIAFGISAFITSLIFVVWLSVLLPKNASEIVAKEKPSNEVTPFDSLKTGVAQVYEASKGLFSDTKKSIDLEVEYNRIKGQVESGQIQIVPENANNQ